MEPERLLAQGFADLKTDLKGFVETRYQMLRAELSVGAKKVRTAGLLLGCAAVFGLLGLMLLSICVSFAIGFGFGGFPGQVGLIWGFLITGGCSVIIAAATGMAGKARLKAEDITPKRTLQVLQRDQESLKRGVQENVDEQSFRRRA